MQFTTLAQWLTWLETFHSKSIDLGLERILKIAEKLQLTHFKMPVITVAGTNGKGSTIATMEACYLAQGFRVGVYTSPHLIHFNERVRLNGKPVIDDVLMTSFDIIHHALGDTSLSYFEFTTLAALLIFKNNPLDVLILEIGLGGRLDAVNIVESDVAVITTIDYDHQDYLGDTREQIGFEKASIIRDNKPVVVMETDVPQSIVDMIKQKNARAYFYQKDYVGVQPQNISIPKSNIATALMVIEILQARLPVSAEAIKIGLTQIQIIGRCQIIQNEPLVMVDVAHNAQSARRFAEFVKPHVQGHKVYALFSALKDKDIAQLVEPFAGIVDEWHIAKLDTPRAVSVEQIQNHIVQKSVAHKSILEAYDYLLSNMTKNDILIIYGSFFTVGEILKK